MDHEPQRGTHTTSLHETAAVLRRLAEVAEAREQSGTRVSTTALGAIGLQLARIEQLLTASGGSLESELEIGKRVDASLEACRRFLDAVYGQDVEAWQTLAALGADQVVALATRLVAEYDSTKQDPHTLRMSDLLEGMTYDEVAAAHGVARQNVARSRIEVLNGLSRAGLPTLRALLEEVVAR